MHKKVIAALIALSVGVGAAPAGAFDDGVTLVPTIKLTIPFGPGTKAGEKNLGIGFQRTVGAEASSFDRFEFDRTNLISVQPVMFNVGWSSQGLESLGFAGLNALVKETRLNADGSESTTLGIRTDYLVMGLVGAAVVGGVVYAATKGDDTNDVCYNGLGAQVPC